MAATPFLSLLQPLAERQPEKPPKAAAMPSPPSSPPCEDGQAAQQRAEAEQALARAKQEATEVLDDARVQAEALREAAWQEGFHNGKEAGRLAVARELRKEHDAQMDIWRGEIEGLVADIGRARQELWAAQETEMVAFVMDIARQVVKTEVTQNPQVITEMLHNALRRVTDKEHVRIRVSLADAAGVRAMRDDLINLIDGTKNLEIVDDRRIGPGGCVVETGAGTIDAKIETQLDEVERALTHAVEK